MSKGKGWTGESRRHSLASRGIASGQESTQNGKTMVARGVRKHPRKRPSYINVRELLTEDEQNKYDYWNRKLKELMGDFKISNAFELAYYVRELEDSGEITTKVADRLHYNLYWDAEEVHRAYTSNKEKRKEKEKPIYLGMTDTEYIEYAKHDPESIFYNPEHVD